MATAAYGSTLKVGAASTAMTGEACGSLTATRFQITSSAHRIVDPAVAIIVYDGGVPVAAAGYSLDYAFGIITFGVAPGGAVTIDGAWLGTVAVAECRKTQLQVQRAQLDKTTFDSVGWREFLAGLLEWSGSCEILAQPTDDLDTGTGGTQSFFAFLTNGTPKLIEFKHAGKLRRGWATIEKADNGSEVAGLVTAEISFRGASQAAGASLSMEEVA